MHDDTTPRSPRPGASPSLATVLADLDHPGARRPLSLAPAGGFAAVDGWVTLAEWLEPGAAARRQTGDPVATLGIAELTGAMAFHALAVPLVDVACSLLVGAGASIALAGDRLWVRADGHAAVALAVGPTSELVIPADVERLADDLVALLDPVVALVEPLDRALRWGAVADLVAILGLGRARARPGDSAEAWERIASLVVALAARRPVAGGGPVPLEVAGPDGPLLLARRCSCCQWHRAARVLGEDVADARCADCPSLDPSTNATRLAALAATGDLGTP